MEEIPKTPKDEKVLDNSVDKKARYVIPIIYLSYIGVFVVAIVLNQSWKLLHEYEDWQFIVEFIEYEFTS